MNENIGKLRTLGQALWYDNIRRGLLENGELARFVNDGVIRGLTSNPTIFEKAIAASSDYDAAFRDLVSQGASAEEIYLALVEHDIRGAADLLRPVYDETHGADGYVSLEVSPLLAHDTEGTIKDAVRLHELMDRPNLMIKVPGTLEGIPAIRTLIRQGISVNVTLLFSLSQYRAIAGAYLEGLEDRLEAGLPLERVASVASFFVSRVDTLIDKRLAAEHPDKEEALRGKAAIANAKLASVESDKIFGGKRWGKISAAGGRLQRLLWASTSTKNPRYPDTIYVDGLIGPETVNTVPPSTLEAFLAHGDPKPRLTQGIDEAREHVNALMALGIDPEAVGEELQVAGVKAFAKSMNSLMEVIQERRAELAR